MAREKIADRFERWPAISEEYRHQVQRTLTGMSSGNLLENCFYSFKSAAEVFAIESYFIKNDLAEAKNWFYVSALASMVAMERYGKDELSFSRPFDFALLSDSKELQARIARWRYPEMEARLAKRMFMASNIRITQHLLLNEDEKAIEVFNAFLPNAGKKDYAILAADIRFLDGMVFRDRAKVEEAIHQLLEKKMVRYRNKDSIPGIGEWLSHPAMWYAKLAWIKGMEIEIDHPLVPMALLPVAPLPEYKSPWPFLA